MIDRWPVLSTCKTSQHFLAMPRTENFHFGRLETAKRKIYAEVGPGGVGSISFSAEFYLVEIVDALADEERRKGKY